MNEPYYDEDRIAIYHGDCRDVLPTLEAGSVNCCVTSPPYWGLRDYQTATWEGGEEGCDHSKKGKATWGPDSTGSSTLVGKPSNDSHALESFTGGICRKCGAKRIDKQLGLEATPEVYVETMVAVFHEVWRVLRDDGTLWLNLGDSYAGSSNNTRGPGVGGGKDTGKALGFETLGNRGVPSGLKPKDLVGIPWRVAFALQADGWYLRSDIIWHKPNPMPESVTDRPTKSHEYLFLLAKSQQYYYDAKAIASPAKYAGETISLGKKSLSRGQATASGRKPSGNANADGVVVADFTNKRSVWTVTTKPYPKAHFAVYPPDLIEPCIKAGCPEGGLVLDPFVGSGTTAAVANKHGCRFVGCEINEEYMKMAVKRFVDSNGYRQRSFMVIS